MYIQQEDKCAQEDSGEEQGRRHTERRMEMAVHPLSCSGLLRGKEKEGARGRKPRKLERWARSDQDKPVCMRLGVLLWVIGSTRTLMTVVVLCSLSVDTGMRKAAWERGCIHTVSY